MSEKSTTLRAIELTRKVLTWALKSPNILTYMAANDVAPDAVEDVVTEILEYLDKTAED